jgi:hypothetical protein
MTRYDYDNAVLCLVSDVASRECETPDQCGDMLPRCLPCRARSTWESAKQLVAERDKAQSEAATLRSHVHSLMQERDQVRELYEGECIYSRQVDADLAECVTMLDDLAGHIQTVAPDSSDWTDRLGPTLDALLARLEGK